MSVPPIRSRRHAAAVSVSFQSVLALSVMNNGALLRLPAPSKTHNRSASAGRVFGPR